MKIDSETVRIAMETIIICKRWIDTLKSDMKYEDCRWANGKGSRFMER